MGICLVVLRGRKAVVSERYRVLRLVDVGAGCQVGEETERRTKGVADAQRNTKESEVAERVTLVREAAAESIAQVM